MLHNPKNIPLEIEQEDTVETLHDYSFSPKQLMEMFQEKIQKRRVSCRTGRHELHRELQFLGANGFITKDGKQKQNYNNKQIYITVVV